MKTWIPVLVSAVVLIVIAVLLPPAKPLVALDPLEGEVAELHVLFETSDACMSCHNQLQDADGNDISIGLDWQTSMMANSARDPYWQAAVIREITDHPWAREAIENECSRCHMPMSSYQERMVGQSGAFLSHIPVMDAQTHLDNLAADGVSCTTCHSITAEGQGTEESFVGHFKVDEATPMGERPIYGPFEVEAGQTRIMHSASGFIPEQSTHIQESAFCASCHTLITHTLGDEGEVLGELPEQVPYLEWLYSDYADKTSCQDCHMPEVNGEAAISSVMGTPRENVSRHVFKGGNFFMQKMLGKYRDELGVPATTQAMNLGAMRTIEHLQENAALLAVSTPRVSEDMIAFDVTVTNKTGHKLPTAYPSRRVWLHVVVRDAHGDIVFESGRLNPDGSIEGNDNDQRDGTFEPHYAEVSSQEQVQIYEPILVDVDGNVTTGLLTALNYTKDNRIPPLGFDVSAVEERVAVQGAAKTDSDFRGGSDQVRYRVSTQGASGPFMVEAGLWYQPIGFRWARNLGDYEHFEAKRFDRYYSEMAHQSGARLATATSGTR